MNNLSLGMDFFTKSNSNRIKLRNIVKNNVSEGTVYPTDHIIKSSGTKINDCIIPIINPLKMGTRTMPIPSKIYFNIVKETLPIAFINVKLITFLVGLYKIFSNLYFHNID